jgi:hypothetical protein
MIEQASLQRGKRFSVHIWWYFEIYNSVPTGRVTKLALHRTLAGGRNYIVCCSFWAREMDWMWLFFCGKVLLLDEITVDLDVLARADLVAFLKSECEERGATIIYATHIFDGLESWPSHLVMFSLWLTPRLLALHAEVTSLIFILFLHLSCKQTGATALKQFLRCRYEICHIKISTRTLHFWHFSGWF